MIKAVENLDLKDIKIDPSNLTISESLDVFQSKFDGISELEAKNRLLEYGENRLPESKGRSKLKIFLDNFRSPLVYALLAAAFFALIINEFVDVVVILVVVILNSTIGYIQEIKAKKDIEALKKMSAFSIKVIREGKIFEIDTAYLVPGDIAILEEGTKIPADGRLIEANNLLINESSLTGESELIYKSTDVVKEKDDIASKNMVFQGTIVSEGAGKFVIFATGQDTRFGKIALFAQETESKTPIQVKIENLSKQIGLAVFIISALVLFIGVYKGYSPIEMVQLAVSLAVSAIPEGLPIAVTVVLVLGAKRMAKKKAIVRNMMAVETLGTTTIIATDKTGTLTHNKLKVTSIFVSEEYTFEQETEKNAAHFTVHGKNIFDINLKRLLTAAAVCNDSEFADNGDCIGESTDVAILENATALGINKKKFPRLDEMPFSSVKRFMAIHTKIDDEQYICIKGSPEDILSKCNYYFDDKRLKLTEKKKTELLNTIQQMSQRGLRVIAVAEKIFVSNFNKSLDSDFTFLGLIGLKDTYRPGVKDAIAKCKQAGIKIIMLTGDHIDTATTIAKNLGIIKDKKEATLAQDFFLPKIKTDQDIGNISVFARILPEFKYQVIDIFKKNGEIVAMTGDGVNDVPALRKADIGIAMGISGTDAAKEAADIVLADDNFATIVAAIEEGRTIFANLRKTLLYLFSTSLGEVLTVIGSMLVGLPLPITPLQILWINLITDTSATIPLGVEPKEDDHLKVPPRDQKEGLVSPLILRRSLLVGTYMAICALLIFWNNLGFGIEYARTVTFLFLSISQWFNAINCRSEKKSVFTMNFFSNPSLLLGLFLSLIGQIVVMYIGFFASIFNFVPVGINAWYIAIVSSFGLILIVELDKLITSWWHRL